MAEADPFWPAPLDAGDVVAVVAPSGPVEEDRLARGVALVEGWGLRVRVAPHVRDRHGSLAYLAGSDEDRAADLQSAWCDPAVRAVWAARGGYGAQRMVDLVDYGALRDAGPRHLIGFSDVTALHGRLGRELGQVTVHAPGLTTVEQLAAEETRSALQRMVMARPRPGSVLVRGRTARPGAADGLLVGGNLAVLAADVGIEPVPARRSIALLEDVGEPAYKVDRAVTQLLRAGWFDRVAGIVIGDVTGPDERPVEAGLLERLRGLDVPMITGVPVGHGARNLPLPLGARVSLDTGELRLA